jgi:F-type H+-transporting ATPase subunit gamma
MQLIATARFQAAFNRATATKPYAEKLAELVSDISAAAENVHHRLMQTREDVRRSALVVITSNRGLCGGYNSNVLRTAMDHLDGLAAEGVETDVHMVGKKGVAFFRFLRRPTVEQITHISDSPQFEQVEPIANGLMDRFVKGEIGSAYAAYMQFFSAAKQRPVVARLLPLVREESNEAEKPSAATRAQFEFSPEPEGLLDELLPATVRAQLFQCFTDAGVSEQVARMVAMKAATDAAGEMIKTLTRQYNRARQTQITMELLDIVGGANALA